MMHYCLYIEKKVSLALIHTSCRSESIYFCMVTSLHVYFYKRCVLVSMILSFLCSSNNASLTPFTCNVLGLLLWWWCMVICLKRLSKNSLIHFYKRCVSVPMILSFLCSSNNASLTPFTCRLISLLCSSNDAPLTSVCFTCNVLGLYIRWWCMIFCL